MLIHDTKVCDKCCRNTHHVDYSCCRWCAGMVPCRKCQEKARRAPPARDACGRATYRTPRVNYHPRKDACCPECAGE